MGIYLTRRRVSSSQGKRNTRYDFNTCSNTPTICPTSPGALAALPAASGARRGPGVARRVVDAVLADEVAEGGGEAVAAPAAVAVVVEANGNDKVQQVRGGNSDLEWAMHRR